MLYPSSVPPVSEGSLDLHRSYRVHQLYCGLHEALNLSYTEFHRWIGQYIRPTRVFHGLDHLLYMSQQDTKSIGENPAKYSMIAGFFHDEDYPSIGEGLTDTSRPYIEKYIDKSNIIKNFDDDDIIGKIACGVFGFKPGDKLSPFAGMNEFYCAVAAACELEYLEQDPKIILAIVAGIEATVPFRSSNRMNELKHRVEKTNELLELKLTIVEIDEIMIGAVHTANKDVMGFLGGLDPCNDDASKVSKKSAIFTIWGGDLLSPEEIHALRTAKSPGDYSIERFLAVRLKRAGLFQLVIPGDAERETIPNLFYNVTLSSGNVYPPNDWAEKANKLAYHNTKPVRYAEYARLISAGLVYSIAALGGEDTDPKKINLVDVVDGIGSRIRRPTFPNKASQVRKIAFECVSGRSSAHTHDVRRSPLAELVIRKLDEGQTSELAGKARELLFTKPKPEKFMKVAMQYLGADLIRVVHRQMILSAQDRQQAVATALGKLQFSTVATSESRATLEVG